VRAAAIARPPAPLSLAGGPPTPPPGYFLAQSIQTMQLRFCEVSHPLNHSTRRGAGYKSSTRLIVTHAVKWVRLFEGAVARWIEGESEDLLPKTCNFYFEGDLASPSLFCIPKAPRSASLRFAELFDCACRDLHSGPTLAPNTPYCCWGFAPRDKQSADAKASMQQDDGPVLRKDEIGFPGHL
jgi:hypothetical protein